MVFHPSLFLLLACEASGALLSSADATFLSLPHRRPARPTTRSAENVEALRALLDRPGSSTGSRVELHVPSTDALSRLMRRSPRYIFGVSTGHSGSTSLSSAESYSGESLEHVLFSFEGKGVLDLPSDDHSARKRWQAWWLAGPSSAEQQSKVRDEYKAAIDAQLLESGSTTYVDLGHHNVEGILRATPEVFGDDLLLIRFRRSRFPTAFSFATRVHRADDSLCNNMWTICPTKNEAVLRPAGGRPGAMNSTEESAGLWTEEQWQQLDVSQQHFWFIDELEAEWQRLLEENPTVSYLECDWTSDLGPCFEAVSAVLGAQPSHDGEGTSQRPHAKQDASDSVEMLRSRDAAYQKWMAFSDASRERIAKVQF